MPIFVHYNQSTCSNQSSTNQRPVTSDVTVLSANHSAATSDVRTRSANHRRLKLKPIPGGPRIWEDVGQQLLIPSHSLNNYSFPSVLNLPHKPSPSPHTCYSWHFLPHIMLLSVIFKPSFSLLLISFTLFSFPSASCSILLL